jgi:hypothetical protein
VWRLWGREGHTAASSATAREGTAAVRQQPQGAGQAAPADRTLPIADRGYPIGAIWVPIDRRSRGGAGAARASRSRALLTALFYVHV